MTENNKCPYCTQGFIFTKIMGGYELENCTDPKCQEWLDFFADLETTRRIEERTHSKSWVEREREMKEYERLDD